MFPETCITAKTLGIPGLAQFQLYAVHNDSIPIFKIGTKLRHNLSPHYSYSLEMDVCANFAACNFVLPEPAQYRLKGSALKAI